MTKRKEAPASSIAPTLSELLHLAEDDPLFKDVMRMYWHGNRARKAGAEVIDLFLYEEIYERDGWVCQLCGGPILRDVPAGWKRGKSIDHWVPLSRGGNHTRENTKAAHVGCNSRKANMTPDEWKDFLSREKEQKAAKS